MVEPVRKSCGASGSYPEARASSNNAMSRSLSPPPASLLDPSSHAPAFGSFRGPLPQPVDLSALGVNRLARLAKEKRWTYFALVADPLLIGIGIVDLGYVANAFAFAYERGSGGLAVDRTALGPPLSGRVNDRSGEGHRAEFSWGGARARIERQQGSAIYAIDVDFRDLSVRARADSGEAPPPISAIARVPGGIMNATEKRALLALSGEAVVCGQQHSLDGGLGGYDYTQGLLARRTAWKWAFLQGRAVSGEKIAVNLVEGFVGEAECALWVDGELFGLSEGRFDHDPARPEKPWRVTTVGGEVALDFTPGGVHAEHRDYRVVASRFVQPMGSFSGRLVVPGGVLTLDGVLGVTEDQSVVW
jgi:hypothetical protein